MPWYRRVSRIWASLEVWLLVAVLLAMIIFAVLQIVLRNVFGTSLFWIDPLNRLLVLWLAVLGAMVATREKEHISIDVLRHYLSGWKLSAVTRSAEFFAFFVCALMAFHSARFVWDEYVYETTTFSGLPAWPFELIMPIGFFIMALRFLASSILPTRAP